jgi:hypothetical protein
MNFKIKRELVTFGETKILGLIPIDVKFWVEADIPESLLDQYAKIAKMGKDADNLDNQKGMFRIMKDVIIGILSPINNKRKVEKFVNQLGIKSANEIFVFLNEYINVVDEEKKNSQKSI